MSVFKIKAIKMPDNIFRSSKNLCKQLRVDKVVKNRQSTYAKTSQFFSDFFQAHPVCSFDLVF